MESATAIFPQKQVAPKRGTLPHHLWPKSVRHDVKNTRRRLKTLQRLTSLATRIPEGNISTAFSHIALWQEVNTPLPLRTDLSPPPRDLASLGLMRREDQVKTNDTSLSNLQSCFKGLKRAIRLLIRHARNLRRLRYNKDMLRLFVKKPSAALKSICAHMKGKRTLPSFPPIFP
jgi:hypothetical protein